MTALRIAVVGPPDPVLVGTLIDHGPAESLFRVDLSRVVSQYVGQTEKELRKIFDAAERSGSVLVFDEADALFGRRTEVKDSHDRFADIDINRVLRSASFDGVVVFSSSRPLDHRLTDACHATFATPIDDSLRRWVCEVICAHVD